MIHKMRILVRPGLGGLVAFSVAACVLAGLPNPAHAYTAKVEPWMICSGATIATEGVVSHMVLLPASGSTVPADTPVTFSAESTDAPTFDVASSEALLSSPDIDSGVGFRSGAHYEFTSTKAAAVPRTIYWRASFTFTPEDCEAPVTFTTPVHTLIVTHSEAELMAAKRQQEEEATKKRGAEEAKEREREAAAGSVATRSLVIDVRGRRHAAIRLTCADVDSCTGKLALTVNVRLRQDRAERTRTMTIATGSFSIAAGKTGTVNVTFNRRTAGLWSFVHRHLNASLTIRRTSPLPVKAEIKSVRLVRVRREEDQ